ncbi:alpha/beta fold hydrolase BchO [Alteriqipengyuania lutimaris]|uniref:Alpha/beta fold hydrolase n=1 Tax=Alteriqipengyuania lutimaris TaxID=1538146 RepID=A0A395LK94_9SPHN|nr:alpha/beta fold hydrolase BchO [Alteriqipengyuania lutimaris]MBB3033805.1 magnesium chelatase accessory protein [Alteriqipengyuania lutimaris]RDS77221.1 alpha/beta fold hydrolase [Alteriqipengyuania lutimaris]
MSEPLNWERDGRHWPHREASRFVESGGIRWHVQEIGDGPSILLLHGTGASSHSWRDVMPALADRYRLVAPDLPGHAFTGGMRDAQMTLPGMAEAVMQLVETMDIAPHAIIGHSAGAAIALRMAQERFPETPIIGLNPALAPFPWPATQVFPAMARLLALNPFVPKVFSGIARIAGDADGFLTRSTGSRIDRAGARCYATLMGNSRHARGALAMMANWDLEPLARALPEIANPVLLIHSDRDEAIPLDSVEKAARQLPDARLEVLPGLGHLAHEERPDLVAELIATFLAERES